MRASGGCRNLRGVDCFFSADIHKGTRKVFCDFVYVERYENTPHIEEHHGGLLYAPIITGLNINEICSLPREKRQCFLMRVEPAFFLSTQSTETRRLDPS